ncbi:leucyl/phenylalanyl-tRNA--protein transferase [Flavobacterium sp.]|uniref:leucyl/phenylalanyl-tRNA--protein transferase n=1 Tax=Flavobacterium sp. TaxID=239 RepID=UPI00286E4705|nr:leucyl/phenylalanyl-tRNA--protein transferase [Flavobacterium sp.]
MQYLTSKLYFPPVSLTTPQGILAAGGDLSPERLLLAYENGIFPWFEDNDPILWWCPERRMVLFLDELKVSHSMRNVINKKTFRVTFNQAFNEVMQACQAIKREGQHGTWISDEMIDSYCKLHEMEKAMSVEVWQNNELVGGLYGIDLGHIFCGESMFSKVSNTSKIAFIALVNYLKERNYKLLDCQIYNDHLDSLGCREISRNDFLRILKK